MNRPGPAKFGSFLAATFGGHSIGMAMVVGFVGLVIGAPARRLLVPYLALAWCGLVFSVSMYWTRRARDESKPWALRFAAAMFLYIQILFSALAFGAVWLQILPLLDAVKGFGLLILPVSIFASISAFVIGRSMEKSQHSSAGA